MLSRGLIAAGVLLAASSAQAAESMATRVAHADKVAEDWAADYARFLKPATEAEDLVTFVVSGIKQGVGMIAAHADRAAVDAWATPWRQQVDDKIAALRADAAANPFPDEATRRMEALSPSTARGYRTLSARMPAARDHIIAESVDFATTAADQLLAADSGDKAALNGLSAKLIGGNRAELEAENVLLEASIAIKPADQPQSALEMSIHASNQALIAMLGAVEAERLGTPVDTAALSKQVRAFAAESKEQAGHSRTFAVEQMRLARGQATVNPELYRRIVIAIGTYDDSAKVEEQVADKVAAIADALDKDGDALKALAAIDGIGPLIDQRQALQESRNQAISR